MTELDNPTALQSIVAGSDQAEAMLEDLDGLEEMADEQDLDGWELKLAFEEKDLPAMRAELRELADAGA
jgi:hypothetical protein